MSTRNEVFIVLIFNNDVISAPILQQLNKYDKLLQKNEGMLQYFLYETTII